MSGGLKVLQPTDDDVTKLLMAKAHIGTKNVDHQVNFLASPTKHALAMSTNFFAFGTKEA
jgi:hypothetical protein